MNLSELVQVCGLETELSEEELRRYSYKLNEYFEDFPKMGYFLDGPAAQATAVGLSERCLEMPLKDFLRPFLKVWLLYPGYQQGYGEAFDEVRQFLKEARA